MSLLVLASLLALGTPVISQTLSIAPLHTMKLADREDVFKYDNGAATAGAYDEITKILYVIGTKGDVLNIVSLADPANPQLIRKVSFKQFTDGFPDAIAICRSVETGAEYLAISFEKLNTDLKAFVRVWKLLETPVEELTVLYERISLDGVDPTRMAWSGTCSYLVIVQQGRVHLLNGQFDDPYARVDVILLRPNGDYTRTDIPILETHLQEANVRHVFDQCEDDSTKTSSLLRDVEPRDLVYDALNSDYLDHYFYITFPKNNALARLHIGLVMKLEYYNPGTKDWRGSTLDTANDATITLGNYPVDTFRQPMGIAAFEHNGTTFLATTEMGEVTRMTTSEHDCQFDESASGLEWLTMFDKEFGPDWSTAEKTQVVAALNQTSQLGNMRFTKLRRHHDYYNNGFNKLTGYGGRGITIYNASDWAIMSDSGDRLEHIFEDHTLPESARAVFNAELTREFETPSAGFDRASLTTGPTPRAIVAGKIGDTQVLVASNGLVGGLYLFTVDQSSDNPMMQYQGYHRSGASGFSWTDAYQSGEVGEPEVKDIVWIPTGASDSAIIAVLSNKAGTVNLYTLTLS